MSIASAVSAIVTKAHRHQSALPDFERPLPPDVSPGVVRIEEDETRGEQSEAKIQGDRSSWKQDQEAAR